MLDRPGIAVTAALTLLLAAAAYPPGRSSQEVVDQGTFTLFQAGARIGDERFLIRAERGGSSGPVYRAGASLNLKVDGRTMRISVALQATGERARPLRYEAQINGSDTETIIGTVVGDRFRLNVRSPAGEEMRELLVRGKAAILDRHVAHHYFFTTRLLGTDSTTEACIVIPRDLGQESAVVEDRGLEPVSIGGREVELRHIALTTGSGTVHHVWMDGDRVMMVEIPEEEFVAIRSDTNGQ
jgi:hypothetical protein